MKKQILSKANTFGKGAVFVLLNSLLLAVSQAALPDISVNFVGCCNNDADPLYSTPTPLDLTDVAGVVPRGNWNNLSGNNVHNAVLNDSNNTPTTVTIFYDADEQWGSNAGKTTPDRKMLNGYLGISNDGHYRPLFFNNVPNGAYKLIMYNGRGDQQPQGYTVNNNTATTLHIMPEGAFTDVWIRGTSTNPNARDVCNYVQFDEVAPIGGTITIDCRSESFRGMMNGIQLIPLAPGAFRFVNQPADVNKDEGGNVSFYGGTVDGTGTVTYQWLTNGVPDTSNLTQTYTRSNVAVNENNRTFQLVATDSTSQSVTSRLAVLTVNSLTKLVSATSAGRADRVYASFGAAIALTGTYTLNNGVTVSSVAYGGTHKEVVLTTSALVDGTIYTLAATGETREDNGDLTVPNPTTINFFHGFGSLCTDFATLPAGTALFNNAVTGAGTLADDGTGTNTVVHLTDDGFNSAYGKFFISNRTGGDVLKVLDAHWRTRIGGDLGAHADGMSFNWADNLVANGDFIATDEGEGTGVSFTIDTWDGGSGPDTGIEIKWQAARIAFLHIPRTSEGNDNFICKDVFVDTSASVSSSGLATFTYNGNTISATIPGWTGIANGAFDFAARTGGENDNMWIDDVCINNFTIGPIYFTLQPQDVTALEGNPAKFTAAVNGSPSYSYQWLTNGFPVAGANGTSYTIASAKEAMEGLQISIVASNDFSSVTSSIATLHVVLSPRVVNVFSTGNDQVHVVYTRAVDLGVGSASYDFDNNIFEVTRAYGASHSEVIITTDPLTRGFTYQVAIANVFAETGSELLPNPTMTSFRHGYSSFCADFASLPAGTTISGNSAVSGGVLHLTDAIGGQSGSFFIPDPNGGFQVDRLLMSFKLLLGQPTANQRIADGMSLNIGSDVVAAPNSEEGAGSGLTISFDTYDNAGADTAPAIEVRYKGTVVGMQAMAGTRDANRAAAGAFLTDLSGSPLSLETSNTFVNVILIVAPDGKLDLYYKDVRIFRNLQLPNYVPFVGANFNFSGRTGGAVENAWIDDLCINAFALNGASITQQPQDTTINEPSRATFKVGVDGLPPYTVQWYSNTVAIAGADGLVYTTPVLNRTANGAGYQVIVSNSQGSVTSRTAIVTVLSDTVVPVALSAASDCSSYVYVTFSKKLAAASANNPANYTINNGVTVTGALLDSSGLRVVLTVSPAINANDCDVLTINGVTDNNASFPNTMSNARIPITAKAPIQASGANNLIVTEAEDYDVNRSPGLFWAANNTANNSWVFGNTFPGFSGTGYMDADPNNGGFSGNTADGITNALRLDYCINFPVAGTYYAWFRGATHASGGSRNSLHFGLDGVTPDEFTRRVGNRINNWGGTANLNDFGWVGDVNGTGAGSFARIAVATPGVHVINVWMREAGLSFDRFLLTTDSAFTLAASDAGPATPLRPATRKVSLVLAPNGSATISWLGAGWTLQGTTALSSTPALTQWQNLPFTSPTIIPPGYFGSGNTNVFFRLICP